MTRIFIQPHSEENFHLKNISPKKPFQSGSTPGTIRFIIPSQTYLPIFELLMRHGVEPAPAKSIAIGELRSWELNDLDTIFKKVKRPSLNFCPFRSAKDETNLDKNNSDENDEES